MALDSYVNLKASIRNWSHRNDIPDELIDDFIVLTETAMWQLLEVRDMSARSTASMGPDRFLALPDEFIKMRRLSILLTASRYLRALAAKSFQKNGAMS